MTEGATTAAGALDGDLLNVDVNVAADADIAAPIDGAVAANANVAAPIDAAVSANVGSVGSEAVAVAQQDAVINQYIEGARRGHRRPDLRHPAVTPTGERDHRAVGSVPSRRHRRWPTGSS